MNQVKAMRPSKKKNVYDELSLTMQKHLALS